jgi:hypothetical protein
MPSLPGRAGISGVAGQAATHGLLGTVQAKVIAALVVAAILGAGFGGGATALVIRQNANTTTGSVAPAAKPVIPSPKPLALTGTWLVVLSTNNAAESFTLTLIQQGTNLTGALIADYYRIGNPISGTLSGQQITLASTGKDNSLLGNITMTGTVNTGFDSISGTYQGVKSTFPIILFLDEDHGTCTATKNP